MATIFFYRSHYYATSERMGDIANHLFIMIYEISVVGSAYQLNCVNLTQRNCGENDELVGN
jgi:hypothetical protein